MNNTTILALASLVALTSTACLSDDGDAAFSATVGITDGKADSVGSRLIEYISLSSQSIWSTEGQAWTGKKTAAGKIQVIAATEQKILLKTEVYSASAVSNGNGATADSKLGPWTDNKLLSIEIGVTAPARAAFMMTFGGNLVECGSGFGDGGGSGAGSGSGSGGIAAFSRVVIDQARQEIHVDDTKTFAFAQCGIELASVGDKEVAVSAVKIYPIMASAPNLVGTHAYTLTTELLSR